MAEYTSEKIYELINSIDDGRLILPAMQRNFVWPEEKISKLFDSLMKDYPIGTLLFWDIDKKQFNQYVFNTFIKDYDEEKDLQRGEKAEADFSDYSAVLDGQQRITSLYLGVKGSFRLCTKKATKTKPAEYTVKYLAVNILKFIENEDDEYEFALKENSEIEVLKTRVIDAEKNISVKEFWVKVAKIYNLKDDEKDIDEIPDYIDELDSTVPELFSSADERKKSRALINKLSGALRKNPTINYYLAKNMKLSKVVDIFVRVNSGGQRLDASDLMLSVAAGENEKKDIQKEIQTAVDDINAVPNNDDGCKVDKELILTAGLMFTGAESLSLKKTENYSRDRMTAIFGTNFESIVSALKNASSYIEYLGFLGRKLTSKNLILPIAYYLYKNKLTETHKTDSSNRAKCDRIFIRQWLIRAMMNSVFSDSTGNTLIGIRNVLDATKKKHFPLEELMKNETRPLLIGDDEIDALLALKWGDSRIVPLFNELSGGVAANANDHVDHIWAKNILTSKKYIKKKYPTASDDIIGQYKKKCNFLSNLELLDRSVNISKSDTEFKIWLDSYKPEAEDQIVFKKDHFIPEDAPCDYVDFLEFFNKREALLRKKIKEVFPNDIAKIVTRYNLQEAYKA